MESVHLDLDLQDVTWHLVLEAISDTVGMAFVFRDYGLLVTTRREAEQIPGYTIPQGLPFRQPGS